MSFLFVRTVKYTVKYVRCDLESPEHRPPRGVSIRGFLLLAYEYKQSQRNLLFVFVRSRRYRENTVGARSGVLG